MAVFPAEFDEARSNSYEDGYMLRFRREKCDGCQRHRMLSHQPGCMTGSGVLLPLAGNTDLPCGDFLPQQSLDICLDEEDEDILDRVWEKIAKEQGNLKDDGICPECGSDNRGFTAKGGRATWNKCEECYRETATRPDNKRIIKP